MSSTPSSHGAEAAVASRRLPRLPFDVVTMIAEAIWDTSTIAEARQIGFRMTLVCREWHKIGVCLLLRRLTISKPRVDNPVLQLLFDDASDARTYVSELVLMFLPETYMLESRLRPLFGRSPRLRDLTIADRPQNVSQALEAVFASQLIDRLESLALVYARLEGSDNLGLHDRVLIRRAIGRLSLVIAIPLRFDPDLADLLEDDDDDDVQEGGAIPDLLDRSLEVVLAPVSSDSGRPGGQLASVFHFRDMPNSDAQIVLEHYGPRLLNFFLPYFDGAARLAVLRFNVPSELATDAVSCVTASLKHLTRLIFFEISALDPVTPFDDPVSTTSLERFLRRLPPSILRCDLDVIIEPDAFNTVENFLAERSESELSVFCYLRRVPAGDNEGASLDNSANAHRHDEDEDDEGEDEDEDDEDKDWIVKKVAHVKLGSPGESSSWLFVIDA
ncbi:hypothetical protein JCM10212_003702 [Sporobolomyces blumeae]